MKRIPCLENKTHTKQNEVLFLIGYIEKNPEELTLNSHSGDLQKMNSGEGKRGYHFYTSVLF